MEGEIQGLQNMKSTSLASSSISPVRTANEWNSSVKGAPNRTLDDKILQLKLKLCDELPVFFGSGFDCVWVNLFHDLSPLPVFHS